jgi:hypothetical protein
LEPVGCQRELEMERFGLSELWWLLLVLAGLEQLPEELEPEPTEVVQLVVALLEQVAVKVSIDCLLIEVRISE